MRILFIGDVVGRTGRDAVTEALPKLRERLRLDLVVDRIKLRFHLRALHLYSFGHSDRAAVRG